LNKSNDKSTLRSVLFRGNIIHGVLLILFSTLIIQQSYPVAAQTRPQGEIRLAQSAPQDSKRKRLIWSGRESGSVRSFMAGVKKNGEYLGGLFHASCQYAPKNNAHISMIRIQSRGKGELQSPVTV
jgi:hypothetical protein